MDRPHEGRTRRDGPRHSIGRICVGCIEDAQVDGGGVSLLTSQGYAETLWTSNGLAAKVEELQFTLGEGPCFDAVSGGEPVLFPDLAYPGSKDTIRWPTFRAEAVASGVQAIFGLPLSVGPIRLGALNLYRQRPGHLTDHQIEQALKAAEQASNALLRLSPEDADAGLDGSAYHWVVHQAVGMLSQQLCVSVGEAFLRLRAGAAAEGTPIDGFAGEVVARRRRLTQEEL